MQGLETHGQNQNKRRETMVKIGFKKFHIGATIPEMAYNSRQAGIDFFLAENITIPAKGRVSTNLQIGWQPDFILPLFFLKFFFKIYMQVKSRSGLAFKKGIEVSAAGVIDEDYRGHIYVLLYNNNDYAVSLAKTSAVCQGIVEVLPRTKYKEILAFKEDTGKYFRGAKGFGSSDKI